MKRGAYKRETPQLGLGLALEEANAGVGDEHDFFPTPSWVTEAIWKRVGAGALSALDPCCGDGGILGALQPESAGGLALHGMEIDPERAQRCAMRTNVAAEVCDSLAIDEWPRVDWVVMNPPFTLAEAFVRRALSEMSQARIGFGVAVLLRLAFLESAERVALHRSHPAHVYVLANRPSFIDAKAWRPCPKCKGVTYVLGVEPITKCPTCRGRGEIKGGSDSTAYAWLVWSWGRPGGHWSVIDDRDPAKKEVRRRER